MSESEFVQARIQNWKKLEEKYEKPLVDFTRKHVDIVDYYNYKAAFSKTEEESKQSIIQMNRRFNALVKSTSDPVGEGVTRTKELNDELIGSIRKFLQPDHKKFSFLQNRMAEENLCIQI